MAVMYDRAIDRKYLNAEPPSKNDWIRTDWEIAIRMKALNTKGEYHHFFHQESGSSSFENVEFVKDGHHKRNNRIRVTAGDPPLTKYQVIVSQDEDGIYVVECPVIPGCVSEGETLVEALENVKEAIRGCLETRRDLGMPLTMDVFEVEV